MPGINERRLGLTLRIAALAASLLGCGLDTETTPADVQQALLPSHFDVQLSFPAGYSQDNVVLHSSKDLDIGNHVLVTDDAHGFPASINIGDRTLEVGPGADTGNLVGGGDVRLGSHATAHGDVQAAERIVVGRGADVTGQSRPHTPLGMLSSLRFTVDFPPATGGLHVGRHQHRTLAPGAYTNIDVAGDLTLSAGKYFLDRFDVQHGGSLVLDTGGGPVIVFVRKSFHFAGEVNGPADHFFVAFLGSRHPDEIVVGAPFRGTIVAPHATLKLAAIGHREHRGSFFAKSIEAAEEHDSHHFDSHGRDHADRDRGRRYGDHDRHHGDRHDRSGHDHDRNHHDRHPGSFHRDRAKIVHDPFDFWHDVLNIHPVLHCVRRFKSPNGAALFGYENESDFPVTIPLGSANRLDPASDVVPPTEFAPGLHSSLFWVPFDLNASMTWHLAGEAAVANGSSTPCQLGDVPPDDEPKPQPPKIAIDGPSIPLSALSGQVSPDVTSSAFTDLPAPVLGGPPALRTFTTGGQAGPASFSITITALNWNDGEGLCGSVDPFVSNLTVNGVSQGGGNSGTVTIPRSQQTVPVSVHVKDDDAFLCLADDDLGTHSFDVDAYVGGNDCSPNGRICYTASATASPAICMEWNAQFIDSSPWNGAPSEDGLPGKGVQPVPASFSAFHLLMTNNSGTLNDVSGVLDSNGCVSDADLPIRDDWQLGTNLKVRLDLISDLCLDSTGGKCAMGTGAHMLVRRTGTTGPGSVCSVFAEDAGAVTDSCFVRQIDWTGMPPSPVRPTFIDQNSLTRGAAVMSHIMKRDAETVGGLGVEFAMATRRLESAGLLTVVVDEFCLTSDGCGGPELMTSCRSGNELLLEPDGVFSSATRFKYIVAHELGHFIQGDGQGLMGQNYGCGPGAPSTPVACRCDHVPPDQQLHCLQSLEEPNAAQIEGYAQFFASKVFNLDEDADCTFAYYKPFANTVCMPGAASCAPDPVSGLQVSQPPVPINCTTAFKWRNTNCADGNSSPDVLAAGTELDWLGFLYGINQLPSGTTWQMADIFNAYVSACGTGATAAAPCTDLQVSWLGSTTHKSLVGGANSMAAGGFISPAAALAFTSAGDTFGVSTTFP